MPGWEQQTIEKVLLETIKEQRRSRRWKIFFRLIFLALIIAAIWSMRANKAISKTGPQIGIVNLKGVISEDNKSYNSFANGLRRALEDKSTVAVIIRANSPGGSPVYSAMINEEIYRLRKVYPKKPIYFVTEEVCASGCYYAAVAANKIYASPASIIGSIGVIYTGFGLTDAMKKVGVNSRLIISGKNKAMGYPLVPENKQQTIMQQQMLDEIHEQFINAVKQGRGNKLANNPDLFSGRYWIGQDALKLGLIDGYATVDSIARSQYKSDNLVDFTVEADPLDKISKKLGMSLIDSAKQAVSNQVFAGSIN